MPNTERLGIGALLLAYSLLRFFRLFKTDPQEDEE
jgi:hypothetical protein